MAGIISTKTIQVGKDLVKTFGEGAEFRKIMTQSLGKGKTLTKVYNDRDILLLERLKQVGNMEEVGDKLIKTTEKEVKDYLGHNTIEQITERVYLKHIVDRVLRAQETIRNIDNRAISIRGISDLSDRFLARSALLYDSNVKAHYRAIIRALRRPFSVSKLEISEKMKID